MASCEDEVLRIGKKFERMIQGTKSVSFFALPGIRLIRHYFRYIIQMDSAMELLDALSTLPVDINILTKTRIGMTINDLRKKTSDEHIAKRAKALIKEWKVLLAGRTSSNSKNDAKSSLAKNSVSASASNGNSKALSQSSDLQKNISGSANSLVTPAAKKQLLVDEIRNKCATMILDALISKDLPDGTLDPEDLAIRTEKKLFEVHRGTSEKYRAALRSRVFNLRDKKNPALRENVLIGAVTPEKYV
ncbi:unnamed protein product [Thelazia callipaeda]|uniref:TFIIS N-terminal domain-containing protein n=1 Tax=Thelazia callipaeda TaxID=103827 RepID=A0A0N5CXT5_THECL|nr:unnamed protein product [Thelazia callipaeda]